jgi:hypothetical protein
MNIQKKARKNPNPTHRHDLVRSHTIMNKQKKGTPIPPSKATHQGSVVAMTGKRSNNETRKKTKAPNPYRNLKWKTSNELKTER